MSDQPTRIVRPNLEYREEPRPARRDGFIRRWFRRLVKLGLVCALLGLAVLGISYWHFVVEHPGEHLERDHILQLISQEAPVNRARTRPVSKYLDADLARGVQHQGPVKEHVG